MPPLIEDPKDPIYPELLAIGGKDMTMRADVLEKYDNLLESPEILRRAGSETDRPALGRYAQEALQAAIASIVSQTDREVAEAALCSKDEFEGLQVQERVRRLSGITIRTFTRRRTAAFKEIITFLKRDAPAATPEPAPYKAGAVVPNPGNESLDTRLLADIATRVARLHYASLGMILAIRFDDELGANGIFVRPADVPLVDYLYRAYIETVYHYHPFRVDIFTKYSRERPPAHIAEVNGELLFSLWQDIAYYGPVRLGTGVEDTLHHDAFGHGGLEARKIYQERWYEERFWWPYSQNRKFPKVAIHLASASGAFLRVLGRDVSFKIPIHASARLLAHKALSSRYEFDEWTPIMNGLSLRHRAEAFFESESVRLTNQALK